MRPASTVTMLQPRLSISGRTGRSLVNTEPFELAGGDYLVSFSASPRRGEDTCWVIGRLNEQERGGIGPALFEVENRKATKDTNFAYGVAPGKSCWYVNGPCAWKVTHTPQEWED